MNTGIEADYPYGADIIIDMGTHCDCEQVPAHSVMESITAIRRANLKVLEIIPLSWQTCLSRMENSAEL